MSNTKQIESIRNAVKAIKLDLQRFGNANVRDYVNMELNLILRNVTEIEQKENP